jgi:hypothetical protein
MLFSAIHQFIVTGVDASCVWVPLLPNIKLQWPESEADGVSGMHGLELIQDKFGKGFLIVGYD